MKRFRIGPALVLVFFAAVSLRAFVRESPQQQNNTPMSFTGELMDNECAAK